MILFLKQKKIQGRPASEQASTKAFGNRALIAVFLQVAQDTWGVDLGNRNNDGLFPRTGDNSFDQRGIVEVTYHWGKFESELFPYAVRYLVRARRLLYFYRSQCTEGLVS